MELPIEQVRAVASLAQIHLSPEEETRLASDLSHTITYIDELAQVDVSAVSEEQSSNSQITGLVNVAQPDEVKGCEIERDAFLRSAPMSEGAYIRVRKVLDK